MLLYLPYGTCPPGPPGSSNVMTATPHFSRYFLLTFSAIHVGLILGWGRSWAWLSSMYFNQWTQLDLFWLISLTLSAWKCFIDLQSALGKKTCVGKRKISQIRREMPFQPQDPSPPGKLPRNLKAKQRDMILCGLKHLQAPIVSWPYAGMGRWVSLNLLQGKLENSVSWYRGPSAFTFRCSFTGVYFLGVKPHQRDANGCRSWNI